MIAGGPVVLDVSIGNDRQTSHDGNGYFVLLHDKIRHSNLPT